MAGMPLHFEEMVTPNHDYVGSLQFSRFETSSMPEAEGEGNQRPTTGIALAHSATTAEDTTFTISLANIQYSDPDGDPLQFISIQPAYSYGGYLTLNGVQIYEDYYSTHVSRAQIVAGQLKLNPYPDYSGHLGMAFSVNDGIDFSSEIGFFGLIVTPVNDRPESSDVQSYITEGSEHAFYSYDFPFNDLESSELRSVKITTLPDPNYGRLWRVNNDNSRTAVVLNEIFLSQDLPRMIFQHVDLGATETIPRRNAIHAADVNADGRVDQLDSQIITSALNQFGPGVIQGRIPESLGYVDTDGDGTLSPLDGLAIINWINTYGGYVGFQFQVEDTGQVTDDSTGTYQSPPMFSLPKRYSFDLFNVNDAPVGSSFSISMYENETFEFGVSNFLNYYTDPNDVPPNPMTGIKIVGLPASGQLLALDYYGSLTTAYVGQVIPQSQIASLRYVSNNISGNVPFQFQYFDTPTYYYMVGDTLFSPTRTVTF